MDDVLVRAGMIRIGILRGHPKDASLCLFFCSLRLMSITWASRVVKYQHVHLSPDPVCLEGEAQFPCFTTAEKNFRLSLQARTLGVSKSYFKVDVLSRPSSSLLKPCHLHVSPCAPPALPRTTPCTTPCTNPCVSMQVGDTIECVRVVRQRVEELGSEPSRQEADGKKRFSGTSREERSGRRS